MRDPFLLAPESWFLKTAEPLAGSLSLRTIPNHVHEILLAYLFYDAVSRIVSPAVSGTLFSKSYPRSERKAKINWDVHFVSMVQSCIINAVALWVIFADEDRSQMDAAERVWGYTGASGMVQGFAAGYFLWDLKASISDVDVHGWGALIHAASALAVTCLGFRPFVNYYGVNLILYELSTPFLNIHWFMDKTGMTGSTAQLLNGVVLLMTFGGSRLVWGTYQSVNMYRDIWTAYTTPGDNPVPAWLAIAYVVANTTLSGLNFFWFSKMIAALRKRFDKPEAQSGKKER